MLGRIKFSFGKDSVIPSIIGIFENHMHWVSLRKNREMGSGLDMRHFVVQITRLAQDMVFEFKVSHDDVIENRKQYRNIAIYLIKKFRSMNNRQIGEFFGNLSYSAVAKAYQRFSAKLKRDKFLRKAVGEITENLSQVKA